MLVIMNSINRIMLTMTRAYNCRIPHLSKATKEHFTRRYLITCQPSFCIAKEKVNKTEDNSDQELTGTTDKKLATDNTSADLTEAEQKLAQELAEIRQENKKLIGDLVDVKDKYAWALADKENLRTRLEKQTSEAKLFGIQGFCKDLLEVADIFGKAISSVPNDKLEAGSILKDLYDGLVLTENQLISVFRSHGLTQFSPEVGDKFDPSLQEAMMQVPGDNNEKVAGTIAIVIRSGWKLHNRCIRSAQVGVVS